MLKIYLDNCCYNRPFDDLKQEKIMIEASAIQIILKKYLDNVLVIYKSMAIDFEIDQISSESKKRQVEDLYDTMDLKDIPFSVQVEERAIELKKYNIKDMDALHIAFAESVNLDYFITTDRLLINAAKRAQLKIKVMNPITFIMEVM